MIAGSPGWLARVDLRAFFQWAYGPLSLHRTSTIIHRKQKAVRRLCERIGYRLEGIRRQGMADKGDACLYGMTADDCTWIKSGTKD